MAAPSAIMNAIYQDEYGGAESYKFGTVPKPNVGPGEVLVSVHAAGVNPMDLKRAHLLSGETFPLVGGYDIAGVVAAVGEGDVCGLKVGDRVFGEVTGDPIAKKSKGAFGEFAAVSARLLGVMPAGATFEEMAATPVAIGTAFQAFDTLGLKPGDKIFITAGAGGVGAHAIQIAKNVYGAQVATTASAAKFDFVKPFGADRIVDYRKEDAGKVLAGWADLAFALTAELPMIKKAVKEGGKICSIVDFNSPDAIPLFFACSTAIMDKVSDAVATGKLKIIIDTIYPFEEGPKAIAHVEGGRAKGKVVIKLK